MLCIHRPGRKLADVRKRLELEILLECSARMDIYSYYQNPLLNHYSSCTYPPLYTRNIEKEVGDTSVGYGQISLSSLWSILFKQTSPGEQKPCICLVLINGVSHAQVTILTLKKLMSSLAFCR